MALSITNTDKEYLWSAETTTCQHSSTSWRQCHPSTSLIINYKQLCGTAAFYQANRCTTVSSAVSTAVC